MLNCKKCGNPIYSLVHYINSEPYHEPCANIVRSAQSQIGAQENTNKPEDKEFTKGVIKWFSHKKGYGFISVEGMSKDVFLHISEYTSDKHIDEGDRVYFIKVAGKDNKPVAKKVGLLKKVSHKRPSRTKTKTSDVVGGSLTGMVVGSMLGPVGLILGGLIGAGSGIGQEITSTCLKCGGTGKVTAMDEDYIGFKCMECHSFWKKRNKDNLSMSDLETDD